MTETATGFAYLAAAVFFILALNGLSSPVSARRGNAFGIIGMLIAIGTTLANPAIVSFELILIGVLLGGTIGTVVALKIKMTALPELVAAFHSLVGLAAVFVATAAFLAPEAYGIGTAGNIKAASLVEMALGTAIGAVTFSGSIIAFAKLRGIMSGNPITFPGQHPLNALLGITLVALVVWLVVSNDANAYWAIVALALLIGFLLIVPIGGADMPVVVSMLNSYSG